ncbi:unnamed protein product [Penicillium salamii]|uniref:Secreted protein n=1 Tax=Penicillium salamii TaxID=1612424 RepID=A0A9W4NA69_9EURO|nr:unnamed protein product [Penicillium salamii]
MQLPMFLILASIFTGAAYCGALQVVDFDGQCVIWSSDNHGCTGHSAAFSQLDGDDCSELSKAVNGTRKNVSVLNVDACGTENGMPAAWIWVNQGGLVTFFNQGGDQAECTLNDKFKVGSWCSAADFISAPSTISSTRSSAGYLTSSTLVNEASRSSSITSSSTASAKSACSCSSA